VPAHKICRSDLQTVSTISGFIAVNTFSIEIFLRELFGLGKCLFAQARRERALFQGTGIATAVIPFY
jgi:hypothetical protein